ncbi:MAG: LysM peptidoglycan-binding domain-containing protein [Pseudomonadota bacterium]
MVAIVTGQGLGLEHSSAWVLGSAGQIGEAAVGRANDNVYVNAATGNLVISNTDEILSARGGDIALARTYNSLGLLDDDNGDNWRPGLARHLEGIPVDPDATGATITRVDWDGSRTVFTRDDTTGIYIATDGAGAYDTIEHDNGVWIWTDGATQDYERYTAGTGYAVAVHFEQSGRRLDFAYDANGLLNTVTAVNGDSEPDEYVELHYDANDNLTHVTTEIRDPGDPNTLISKTRVYYEYNASNRLEYVKFDVNLDGSIADTDNGLDGTDDVGGVYGVRYVYNDDGTIRKIRADNKNTVRFTYTTVDGEQRVSQVEEYTAESDWYVAATFSYDFNHPTEARTTITDALGNVTRLHYDDDGNLTRIYESPGPDQRLTIFTYDADGNVTSRLSPDATLITYSYDANGNVIREQDSNDVTITRIFNDRNELLNETRYRIYDPDISTPAAIANIDAAEEMTTRFVYSTDGDLRFTVSAEGLVTEYQYNWAGQVRWKFVYTQTRYVPDGKTFDELRLDETISLSEIEAWADDVKDDTVGSNDWREIARTDYAYDYRGNLILETQYDGLTATGGTAGSTVSKKIHYLYDQHGQLLSRHHDGETASETFVYDGMGRLISSTDFDGAITLINYDMWNKVVTTFDNGLQTTATYDRQGRLIRTVHREGPGYAGRGIAAPDFHYHYDRDGNLRMRTDDAGGVEHFLYDAFGRKIADISTEGAVTEYRYDRESRVTATIRYATEIDTGDLVDGNGDPTAVTLADLRDPAQSFGLADHADDRWQWLLYNRQGNVTQTIDSDGGYVVNLYNAARELIQTIRYAARFQAADIDAFKATLPVNGTVATVAVNGLPGSSPEDRITRYYHDEDGRLIGERDEDDYITHTIYDAAGRVSEITRYHDKTTASANATFDTILAGFAPADERTEEYFVYDGRNLLRARIDGAGNLTRYDYDPQGNVSKEIRGQVLSGAQLTAFAGSDRTLADVPATGSETLDIVEFERDLYGKVTKEIRDIAGSGTEETLFAYDTMGRLTGITSAANITGEARQSARRYDALGRLVGEMSGKGVDQLAGLTEASDEAAIDAIYKQYGTTYTYDQADRLTRIRAARGSSINYNDTLFYYDGDDNLRYRINELGEVVEYRYNSFGEQVAAIEYAGRVDVTGLVGGSASPAIDTLVAGIANAGTDSKTINVYDALGRLTQSTGAESANTSYAYNAFGQITSATTLLRSSTSLSTTTVRDYDNRGLLIEERIDDGGLDLATLFGYDAFGRLTRTTDANGAVRTTDYDKAGRVIETTDGLGNSQTFTYDGRGNVLTTTDRLGQTTSYSYDEFNRSITMTTPENIVTTTKTNAHGEAIRITDGAGRITEFAYDVDGNLTTTTIDPGGEAIVSTNVYDDAGKLIEMTDGAGRTVAYAYDRADRIVSRTVDPDGLDLTTRYVFDGKGQTIRITDPDGRITELVHDREGRRIEQRIDPTGLNIRTNWVYDEGGRLISHVEGFGTTDRLTNHYHYDAAGRLTKQILDPNTPGNPNGQDIETLFAYDANGNMVARTDAEGHVTRYVYDAENRQIYVVDPTNAVVKTSYDAEGRIVAERAYANLPTGLPGVATTLELDESDISVATDAADDRVARYAYDDDGRLRYIGDALGHVTRLTYDNAGNVHARIEYSVAYATSAAFDFASLESWRSGIHSSDSARRTTWHYYDDANRLRYTLDPNWLVTAFDYDGAGNVTKQIEFFGAFTGGINYTNMEAWAPSHLADAGNRVTRNYYDGAGRLAFTTEAMEIVSGTTERSYFTKLDYDAAGRITGRTLYTSLHAVSDSSTLASVAASVATAGNYIATSYQYDDAGRMTDMTDGEGVVTHYVRDAVGRVTEETADYGGSDARVTRRVYDDAGRMISETVDPSGLSITTGYHYDALGQVIRTTDPNGNTTYFYYDALGRVTHELDPERYVTETAYTFAGEIDHVIRHHEAFAGTIDPDTPPAMAFTASTDAKTSFAYDRQGRLTGITDAMGETESYALNAFGDRVSVTNKLGGTTINVFDRRGQLVRETLPVTSANAQGQQVSVVNRYEYDRLGNLVKTIEADGLPEVRTTLFTHDKAGRVIKIEHDERRYSDLPGSFDEFIPREYFVYDARGNLTRQTATDGTQTRFYYDDADRRTARVDAEGTVTSWNYDARGNMVEERIHATQITPGAALPADGSSDRVTRFAYDKNNRMIEQRIEDVQGGEWNTNSASFDRFDNVDIVTSYAYDANGNLIREIDAEGHTARFYYDALDRLEARIDERQRLITYDRDAEGNVIKETRFANAASNIATYSFGMPAARNDDRITEFTYDLNGNRTEMKQLGITYSTINSSTGAKSTTTGAVTTSYSYNGLGQIASKTEANGDLTDYHYDALGRLLSTTGAQFSGIEGANIRQRAVNVYDGLNNLISTKVGRASGSTTGLTGPTRTTDYTYRAGGLLHSITDASGFLRWYHYDKAGQVAVENYHREKADTAAPFPIFRERIVYERDAVGRVVEHYVTTDSGGGAVAGDVTEYSYNAFGDLASRGINGGAQEYFLYDNAGRLWKTNEGDGVTNIFVRDRNGDVTLTARSNTGALAYSSLDQFLNTVTSASGSGYDSTIKLRDHSSWTLTVNQITGEGLVYRTRELFRDYGTVNGGTITRSSAINAFREVIGSTDARGHRTDYYYDNRGLLIQTKTPSVGVTGENGVTTDQRLDQYNYYDKSGRLVGTRDYAGTLTTRMLVAGTGHDGGEALTAKTFNPDGGKPENRYDIFLDLREVEDALGRVVEHDYDGMGRVTVTRSAAVQDTASSTDGLTTYYAYNGLGQQIGRWNDYYDPGDTTLAQADFAEVTEYDSAGRVISVTDPVGRETTYSYAWSSSVNTSGLADYNGWIKTTVNAAGRTATEKIDYFGRVTGGRDFGGHDYRMTFDRAGRVVLEEKDTSWGSYTQDTRTSYFNTGEIASIVDDNSRTGANERVFTSTFRYDQEGNRTYEQYAGNYTYLALTNFVWSIEQSSGIMQRVTMAYDALGRLISANEAGAVGATIAHTGRTVMDVDYQYDANGNRRSVTWHNGGPLGGSHWYTYDSMNRMIISKGALVGGAIKRTADGMRVYWNQAGERTRAYYDGNIRDYYTYDADGRLTNTEIWLGNKFGTNPAHYQQYNVWRSYNDLGQLRRYTEYDVFNGKQVLDRDMIRYDKSGNITSEEITNYDFGYKEVFHARYYYNDASGNYIGAQTKAQIYYDDDYDHLYTETLRSYAWWDTPVLTSESFNDTNVVNTTTFTNDGHGHVVEADINDGDPRRLFYTTDQSGQVLARTDIADDFSHGYLQHYYYANGRRFGSIGRLDEDIQHARDDILSQGQSGAPTYDLVIDFDQNYAPINRSSPGQAPTTYVVRSGDTLASIAAGLWGDASLWYKIAEANGLQGVDANTALTAGRALQIPNIVTNLHNNADTFRVYDPAQALGDVRPDAPFPMVVEPAEEQQGKKGGGCGVVGKILTVAVAVAVTVVTSGAAAGALGPVLGGAVGGAVGSVASQGFAIATGQQNNFSFKQVGLSAIAGGVSGGLGKLAAPVGKAGVLAKAGKLGGLGGVLAGNGIVAGAARGVAASALTQGVGVATGLQDRFSFTGVAAAGIGGGLSSGLSSQFGQPANGLAAHGQSLASGAADAIAQAATRTALSGDSFGDNLIASIPSVIGNTIGNAVAAEIGSPVREARRVGEGAGGRVPFAEDGAMIAALTIPSKFGKQTDAVTKQFLEGDVYPLGSGPGENGRSNDFDIINGPDGQFVVGKPRPLSEQIIVQGDRYAPDPYASILGERQAFADTFRSISINYSRLDASSSSGTLSAPSSSIVPQPVENVAAAIRG